MKRYWPAIALAFVLTLGLVLPMAVGAQAETFDIKKGIVGNLSYQCREFGNCGWCDFIELVVILQKVILSLFGGLALIMFIWGAQGIILAAGNQEKVQASKKLLTSTLFGVLIILAAYFLINILVGLIITPRKEIAAGAMRISLFDKAKNAEWWRAFCIKDVTDKDYCKTKPSGTPCGPSQGGQVCDNGVCKDPTGTTTYCQGKPTGTLCIIDGKRQVCYENTCSNSKFACITFVNSLPLVYEGCKENCPTDKTVEAGLCFNGTEKCCLK